MRGHTMKIEVYSVERGNEPVLLRFIHFGDFREEEYPRIYFEIATNFANNFQLIDTGSNSGSPVNPYLLVLQAYLQRIETQRGGGTPQEAMHTVKWDGAFYDMFDKVSTLFRNWHILVEFRDCIVQALTETRFRLV